jgi:peptidyl-prolyl cis-trans isomerase C
MKRSLILSGAIAAFSLLSTIGASAQDEKETPTPAPAEPAKAEPITEDASAAETKAAPLIVNGKEITPEQLDAYFKSRYGAQAAQMPPEQLDAFKAHAMTAVRREMVLRVLLLAAADDGKIAVTDEDVTKEYAGIIEGLPEGATIDAYLQMSNTTEEKLKSEIGEELRISKLIESKTEKPAPATDEDVKKFYDDNPQYFTKEENATASHILITVDKEADEAVKAEAKTKIDKIRKDLIDAGEKADFAAAAKEHSSCPSSAQGGSLGSFGHGQMVPEFEAVAFAQKIGEIGEVVETEFGYHIVKVDAREESGKVSLEEAKEKIAAHLTQEKGGETVRKYMDGLQAAAKIEGL